MTDLYAAPVSLVLLAKESHGAKSRLGLDRATAGEVAIQLASATLATVLRVKSVAAVSVVTSDLDIAFGACRRGVAVVPEGRPRGMNQASELGRRAAVALRPAAPVAVMVVDLPYLRLGDLDEAIDDFRRRRTPLFVADRHNTGTTFLIQTPDQPLGFRFGPNSAHMHRRLGYKAAGAPLSGLHDDLDSPEDLRRWRGIEAVNQDREPVSRQSTDWSDHANA